jgi:4-hydroxythreonine-4-phosphate dehydrogenase
MPARRLLVTPGEPAGIGAEILVEAVFRGSSGLVTLDDPDRLAATAKSRSMSIRIAAIDSINDAAELERDVLAVLPLNWPEAPQHGHPDPANAPQVIKAITDAAGMAKSGLVKGIVTCPIQKSALYAAGFTAPGHTEYLGEMDSPDAVPVMMLANEKIRVVPLTVHVPLSAVPSLLSTEIIIKKASILDMSLRRDFGLSNPHIIVTGLNPHAGEEGGIGSEEVEIIAPAVEKLKAEGINISGPVSADTLFHEDRHQDYDAVLAMYHDQALIPVKTLDFHGSVNITIGLSFIRTSPDHGTALDQAGKGSADPSSLIAAIQMAELMADQRYGRAT